MAMLVHQRVHHDTVWFLSSPNEGLSRPSPRFHHGWLLVDMSRPVYSENITSEMAPKTPALQLYIYIVSSYHIVFSNFWWVRPNSKHDIPWPKPCNWIIAMSNWYHIISLNHCYKTLNIISIYIHTHTHIYIYIHTYIYIYIHYLYTSTLYTYNHHQLLLAPSIIPAPCPMTLRAALSWATALHLARTRGDVAAMRMALLSCARAVQWARSLGMLEAWDGYPLVN